MNPAKLRFKCPGIEIESTVFSGCRGLELGLDDCPTCLGKGYIVNCPVCGEAVKSDSTCKQGCWYPLEDFNEKTTS